MAIPGAFSFSPDDRLLTYLFSAEGSLSRQLYVFDTETGQQRLLLAPADGGVSEESLLVGRTVAARAPAPARDWGDSVRLGGARPTGARGAACRSFHVGWHGGRAAAGGGRGRRLHTRSAVLAGRLMDRLRSARRALVSFPSKAVSLSRLTAGANSTGKTHGLAEYIAQEEMGRRHGFWWSPDSAWIAFAEVDETHIPIYRIVHQGKDAVGEGAQEDHRYPFAGQANAKVRLGVVARTGGEPVWMDVGGPDATLPTAEHEYLARVDWRPDGRWWHSLRTASRPGSTWCRFDPRPANAACC